MQFSLRVRVQSPFPSAFIRRLALAAPLAFGLIQAGVAQAEPAPLAQVIASEDARFAAQWVLQAADHQGLPFAVVDKRDARLYVFDASGRLLGASAALLGVAPGDHSVPGVGQRAQSVVPPTERTTPAGRFASEPGHNRLSLIHI